jgi:hypothetical protein
MILIYSDVITPRLTYISRLIFRDILGIESGITCDANAFHAFSQAKLNYSSRRFADEPFILASSLLFSTGMGIPEIVAVESDGVTGFFPTSEDSLMPFDPLASAFLMVSRIEEYPRGKRDQHGRFMAASSILYQYDLLEKPVVNLWADLVADSLLKSGQPIRVQKEPFRYLCTIDVDNGFAYLNKGWIRTVAGFLHSAVRGCMGRIRQRISVLTGREADPYDTYEYLSSIFRNHQQQVLFFFLMGDHAQFDRPVSWKKRLFQKRIRQIADQFRTGIHPSYQSSTENDVERIRIEKSRLEKVTGKPVECSRQHYLRLDFPESYRKLISAGIKEDYTMGYADRAGFRAGICTPFLFYDIMQERETSLKVIPFQVMDVTLRDYMQLSPGEAIELSHKLMNSIRETGGVFSCIWHNESVGESGEWRDYFPVFEFMNKTGWLYAEE